jgi:Holliday junction resolvase RusA-like endonuclease
MEEVLFYAKINIERHVVKKNGRPIYKNKKTGRFFLGKRHGLVLAEDALLSNLETCRIKHGITDPIDFPIHCIFTFCFNASNYYTKKGEISKKLPDLSNLIQLPEDCLEKARIIANDSLIHSLDGSRRLAHSSTQLEIKILRYKGEFRKD